MSFFWHTQLGLIYFIILTAICAFAIWRGGREYRLFAYCVAGVFLADRFLLASGLPEAPMIGLGAVAELIALIAILEFAEISATARCIGFLFLAKMMAYVCLLSGFVGFETMAAWTETAGYLMLLLIGGGTFHELRGKRSKYHRSELRSMGHLSSLQNWLASKRRTGGHL